MRTFADIANEAEDNFEDVDLNFDLDSKVVHYVTSDFDEDPSCDFDEKQPHSDATRKLAE